MISFRIACVLAAALLAPRANGQCPGWTDSLELSGVDGGVFCSAVYDDGSGSALYLGGTFLGPTGRLMPHLARWNGSEWSDVGGTTNGFVYSLIVADDGTGPKLYAGGAFTTIGGNNIASLAKWDGTTWSSVGPSAVGPVSALCAFQSSSGWRLYAATDVDPSPNVSGEVQEFDGSTWTTIGNAGTYGVSAMCAFDFGNGPELVAGGTFTSIDGVAANNLARWNESAWSPIGSGTNGPVLALLPYDDGSGPSLFVGGNLGIAGGVTVAFLARFDGSVFHAIPNTPMNGRVYSLAAHDDGSGPALYVGSLAINSSGSHPIQRWNGSSWSVLGSGVTFIPNTERSVRALVSYDDGNGNALAVGGNFSGAGGLTTPSIALWRGGAWERVGHEEGVRGQVRALARFDDGSGAAMYAAGAFEQAGGTACASIARFDGSTFSPLANGITRIQSNSLSGIETLCGFDAGSGPELYAGGLFVNASGVASSSSIARWNGTAWSALGSGITNPGGGVPTVRALVVHDEGSGPHLIVGGRFRFAGGVLVNNIARWDGTNWSALGNGLVAVDGGVVPITALAVYDTGSGPELYAAGTLMLPDSTWYIARWNGTTWSSVGGGLYGEYGAVDVRTMCVADLGAGPKLYVGGRFDGAPGALVPNFLAWDGAWSAPSGVDLTLGWLNAFASFDEGAGAGPALFVTGTFLSAGFNGIARYDGASFSPLDNGLTAAEGYTLAGQALAVFDDDLGAPALYVGGQFDLAGTRPACCVARWRGCGIAGEAFCSGDGSATACPCGNAGAIGHGCATSTNPQGAELQGSGLASISSDSLVLACTGTSNSTVTYFQGTQQVNGGAGAVFGDGLRCAGGVTLRLGHVLASGGASSYPNAGDAAVSVRGAVGALGGRRNYQVWFRNAGSFCTPSTFNLSNGWTIVWAP